MKNLSYDNLKQMMGKIADIYAKKEDIADFPTNDQVTEAITEAVNGIDTSGGGLQESDFEAYTEDEINELFTDTELDDTGE